MRTAGEKVWGFQSTGTTRPLVSMILLITQTFKSKYSDVYKVHTNWNVFRLLLQTFRGVARPGYTWASAYFALATVICYF